MDNNEKIHHLTEFSPATKLVAGSIGISVGLIDQVVSWAQVISIVGGAIIVVITLIGMAHRAYKKIMR
jgi:hypothetical protein